MLDVFDCVGYVDNTLHIDAGRNDVVRIDIAGLNQMLDLGDRHLAGVAITGLKLRAVLRYTRLPSVSAMNAWIIEMFGNEAAAP